jgi:hypothetical protein
MVDGTKHARNVGDSQANEANGAKQGYGRRDKHSHCDEPPDPLTLHVDTKVLCTVGTE